MRLVLAAAAVAVLAGCGGTGGAAAAPTTPAPSRTLAAPSPLGPAVRVSERALGAGTVAVQSITSHTAGATPADPPPQNGTYVVAHVVVTGGPLLATPNAFAVFVGPIGPLGTETLQGNASSSGLGVALPTRRLAPGQSVSGNVVFDVAGPHGYLVYDEGGAAETVWRF